MIWWPSAPLCIDYNSAEVGFVPSTKVELEAEGVRKIMNMIDALEESDDVQDIYTNFTASDEVLKEFQEEE